MDFYKSFQEYKDKVLKQKNLTEIMEGVETSKNYTVNSEEDLLRQNLNNNFSFIKSKFLEGKLVVANNFNHIEKKFVAQFPNYESLHDNFRGSIKKVTQNQFEHLRSLVKTLQEMYPDAWNLECNYNSSSGILGIKGFSLHFPKIKLTNENQATHILRDVYTFNSLEVLNTDYLRVGTLLSTRTTTTEQEHNRGYFHSHVQEARVSDLPIAAINSRVSSGTFRNMCLGNNSTEGFPIDLRNFNNYPNSMTAFRTLLLSIRGVMRFESLAGGPYKRISEYFGNTSNSNYSLGSQYRINNYTDSSISSLQIPKVSKMLLLHALQMNPNLLFKFDVKSNPFLYKEVIFQDESKLEKVLINSYKDLCSKVRSPEDVIRIVDNSDPRNRKEFSTNLLDLSKIFYTLDSQSYKKKLNPYYYFLPDAQVRQGATPDTVVRSFYTLLTFRGTPIVGKVVRSTDDNNPLGNLTKVNVDDLDIKISPSVFNNVKNNLITKITKNVFKREGVNS